MSFDRINTGEIWKPRIAILVFQLNTVVTHNKDIFVRPKSVTIMLSVTIGVSVSI